MAERQPLPFKIGQHAEIRCFKSGFRGAWFRCKIKKITRKGRESRYALEYYDFPDEKLSWMKAWQVSPVNGDRVLMIRPSFPQVYTESKKPDVHTLSKSVFVTRGIWKVGDLVDWLADGCFWSGRITEIIDEKKAKIQLHDPPIGEGSAYEVLCDDLRPSLDWTPELGWQVPTSIGTENGPCARMMHPVNGGLHARGCVTRSSSELSNSTHTSASSLMSSTSDNSIENEFLEQIAHVSKAAKRRSPLANMDIDIGDSRAGKTSSADSGYDKDASQHRSDGGPLLDMGLHKSILLNSSGSDAIESAILDLEELVNKVKWIRRILEFGTPSLDVDEPAWKFLEYRTGSTSK